MCTKFQISWVNIVAKTVTEEVFQFCDGQRFCNISSKFYEFKFLFLNHHVPN